MRNFTITRIWGIPIRINVSLIVFLPVLAWLLASGGQMAAYAGLIQGITGVAIDVAALRTGYTPVVIGVLAAVGLFVSVTLHELGHSWVALRYGLSIESITLWILGGIAALSAIPREWNREFWIAIAGPVTSVLVAAVCWIGVLAIPASAPVPRFVVGWLAVTNLVLAAFNLVPAFPMDGGRILRALLARSRPYASATRIAGRIGVVFAILFAVVGVMSFNVILILLALFLYGAATTESRTVLLDELLDGFTVGDIMTREPHTVQSDETVAGFVNRMLRERQTVYPVTDAAGEVVGIVSIDDLRRVPGDERETTRVESVMREPARLEADADAFDTLAVLTGGGTPYALVMDGGRITGLLSEGDYAHALSFRRGFQAGVR